MIKFKLRKNLLYLLALYIFFNVRNIVKIIIFEIFDYRPTFLYIYMMNLGQIFGGLTVYFYQFITSRKKKQIKYFGIELIHNKKRKLSDSWIKIIILIFFAALFHFIESHILQYLIERRRTISSSLGIRLGSLSTIFSSLICTYALNFKFAKHHKFSLIFIGICLIITIISEILFNYNIFITKEIIYFLFYIFCRYIFITFTDCIERYLVDYDYLNPFIIIVFEGVIGLIFSILNSLQHKHAFEDVKNIYKKIGSKPFVGLIFLLILYLLLSAALNVYKIYCNVIYTPMAKSLMEYILAPLLCIYYLLFENDFYNNYYYFAESEILCLIIDFFCCVYNEYIILYYCGLEHETKDEISLRANIKENINRYSSIDDETNDNDSDNNDNSAINN